MRRLVELCLLQPSLRDLKVRERWVDIYFWGKIMGMDSDYYVAYALNDDQFEVPSKVFYYSGPDFNFVPLEEVVLSLS